MPVFAPRPGDEPFSVEMMQEAIQKMDEQAVPESGRSLVLTSHQWARLRHEIETRDVAPVEPAYMHTPWTRFYSGGPCGEFMGVKVYVKNN